MNQLLSETIDELIELENKLSRLNKLPDNTKGKHELINRVSSKLESNFEKIKQLAEQEQVNIKTFLKSVEG